MKKGKLKDRVQDCHVSFLLGSGLSHPYLATLGSVEDLLTSISKDPDLTPEQICTCRASVLGSFFEKVIDKSQTLYDVALPLASGATQVLSTYREFLNLWHSIIESRDGSLLSKQVNLFTTNVDLFLERALEDNRLDFNDGFSGRFSPTFSLSNFRKSVIRRSAQFDNKSEVPVFNLFKVHGSLTWDVSAADQIVFSDFSCVSKIRTNWQSAQRRSMQIEAATSYTDVKAALAGYPYHASHQEFLDSYDQLAIVNPTKEKFQETVLNLNYHELLRIFSSELERENALLIVAGFSMADEHIREIVIRAANSNPTLQVVIYPYDRRAAVQIRKNIRRGNVPLVNNNISLELPRVGAKFDLATLNRDMFRPILS